MGISPPIWVRNWRTVVAFWLAPNASLRSQDLTWTPPKSSLDTTSPWGSRGKSFEKQGGFRWSFLLGYTIFRVYILYNVSFKEVTESELPYFFRKKATWPLRIDRKCPKNSSPKVKKRAVKSIPKKTAPAYTKTWPGNILFFTGSAVFLFESRKAGRYSCIKKKGKQERISTVTVFSRPQNTSTAGYQGVFPHLSTKKYTHTHTTCLCIDLHVPCSPVWPARRQQSIYETSQQEEDSMEGPPFSTPPSI